MKKIMVILFFLILAAPNLVGKALKADVLTEEEKEMENRQIREFPHISGENWQEAPAMVEEYINDHAPWRGKLLDAYAGFNWDVLGSVDNREVLRGKDGWLFYKQDDSVEDAIGIVVYNESHMRQVLERLLAARERCTDHPDQFILLIAPNKEQVCSQYMPESYKKVTDTSTAKELVAYIREHSDIKVVYPLEELKEAAEETGINVYHKTDTHWNEAGGFVGVMAIVEALGEEAVPLREVEIQWVPDVIRGDLAKQVHIPQAYIDDPYADITPWVNSPEAAKKRGDRENRRIVVVGDSFRVGLIPGMNWYFGDVFMVDQPFVTEADPDLLKGDIFVYEIVERCLNDLDRFDRFLAAVSQETP